MSPAAKTPSMLVIMERKSIISVPQPETCRPGALKSWGIGSGSKPSALITMSASMLKEEPGMIWGACRPEVSGTPRWTLRARMASTLPSPITASGAESQTNSTPSSSAWRTSRWEPGMLMRSRR